MATLHDPSASWALRPIIHDLVRTRFPVPQSIFVVEHVQAIPLTSTGRWQVIRLILSDGDLCIQAVLSDAMHHFVHTRDIGVGSYVRVDDFQFRTRSDVVFLVVHDLTTVGWNDDLCRLYEQQKLKKADDATSMVAATTPTKVRPTREASPVPIALPRDWHDIREPLKLTTLRSVPTLPYRQNWSCNVLVIVSRLSPVETSHLPPHKQRVARITDPSTAKQVHLTVFLDPDEFAPKVGSAVLLTGVKNHRFDGGSLRKYASDKGRGRWWFEDPWEMEWCDVKGIKNWWADMEAYFASQASDDKPA